VQILNNLTHYPLLTCNDISGNNHKYDPRNGRFDSRNEEDQGRLSANGVSQTRGTPHLP
jgi:hypothetical protein